MAEVLAIPCPAEWPLGRVDEEHRSLFVVPGARYVAPYESVYRDAWHLPVPAGGPSTGTHTVMVKGLLMGASAQAVKRCYLNAGLAPIADLPDHISNELRFLAYLWNREAAEAPRARRATAKLRARFLDEHLLRWIDALVQKVSVSDRLGFHTAALRIAELVLRSDGRALRNQTDAHLGQRSASLREQAPLAGVS